MKIPIKKILKKAMKVIPLIIAIISIFEKDKKDE